MGVNPGNAETKAATVGREIAGVLGGLNEHPVFGLASLCSVEAGLAQRHLTGAYYTDTRLAAFLAERVTHDRRRPLVLDAAAGAGVLLAAVALQAAGKERRQLSRFVAESLHAGDRSSFAVDASRLVFVALAGDLAVIPAIKNNVRCVDSLLAGPNGWADVAPEGFDLVVGNPPWERLKLTRHEHLALQGVQRHYGAEYQRSSLPALLNARDELRTYLARLMEVFHHQGSGEADLYKLFTELTCQLVRTGGRALLLLPGALIRAQGAGQLRELMFATFADIDVFLFMNRKRYFPIDTRFKFVVLDAGGAHEKQSGEVRLHVVDDPDRRAGEVRMDRRELRKLSPDLSLPEVRSQVEWNLFRRMMHAGTTMADTDGPWRASIVRELDMTRDRELFERRGSGVGKSLPVVEGRMISQFRHAAKRYVCGTGRAAQWKPTDLARCRLEPQFIIPVSRLGESVRTRAGVDRFGFCDITGQTNERTMLAAWIPSGAVCGNKVPTVTFSEWRDLSPQLIGHAWLAICNSLAFDWLLRRMVTTSVNFFLLLKMGFPGVDPSSPTGRSLAALSEAVSRCSHSDWQAREVSVVATAARRAQMDWVVAKGYGLGFSDLELILADFRLLDRAESPIPGEARSTITRDVLLLHAAREARVGDPVEAFYRDRVAEARRVGAVAYRTSYLDYEDDAA